MNQWHGISEVARFGHPQHMSGIRTKDCCSCDIIEALSSQNGYHKRNAMSIATSKTLNDEPLLHTSLRCFLLPAVGRECSQGCFIPDEVGACIELNYDKSVSTRTVDSRRIMG